MKTKPGYSQPADSATVNLVRRNIMREVDRRCAAHMKLTGVSGARYREALHDFAGWLAGADHHELTEPIVPKKKGG